jgi:Domain of unknown function DUF11
MPNYNPNSIWESKEKKYVYNPGGNSATPNKPTGSNGGGQPRTTPSIQPPSFFHRHRLFFFGAGLILALALIGLVFYLILPTPAPNVVISFSDPGTITIGIPFPLTITVSNESKSVLQNAELNITLPAGISLVGGDPTQSVVAETVGTLSSQTINPPQTIELIAGANPGSSESITANLTYQTAATASTEFQTSANTSLTTGSQSAMSLTYTAPSSIFSGQNFDLAVEYQNNTTSTLQGAQLQMQYPPAYNFVAASGSAPTNTADTTWNVGTLGPNATGTLVITGNIVGPQNAQYQLTGTINANFSGQNYPVSAATPTANFSVAASPLSLSISLNGSSSYVAGLGDTLNYVLTYSNNSNVTFQNMDISATLVGQMYNFSSLKTTGSFNSQNNMITWYTADTPQLASLAPGQSGSVDFTIDTQKTFPIRLPSNKDYSLGVTAQIESPTVPPNTAGKNTTSITSLSSKVGGVIALTSAGYSHETTPGIVNKGPYPPTVNQPTQYTIHWDITNYSTDAENVTVSAYLQSGTTFTGVETSTIASSSPSYDAATGLVTWTIPYIPATTGVISAPAQAVFQVSNTPAVNQVGQTVTLLGPTTLTATDAFTSSSVDISAPAVTTQLPSDPSVANQTGAVTQ